MKILPAGSTATEAGSSDYFSGTVRLQPLVNTPEPTRLRGALVTFNAGSRTAWHTHPLGQTLIVVSGVGLAQSHGQPVRILKPGDVVWFEPGEKHWHGASADTDMAHYAFQEALDGKAVEWLEHVSDAEYGAPAE